jgi:hypothetical protein
VSEAAVYRRGMAVLDAQLASTYRASPWMYEALPGGTREVGHLSFAVAVLETEMQSTDDRQRATTQIGLQLRSRVGVRLMARIRQDGGLQGDIATAYSAGESARAALIDAATGNDATNGPQTWRWVRTSSTMAADSTHLVIDQVYTVQHRETSV